MRRPTKPMIYTESANRNLSINHCQIVVASGQREDGDAIHAVVPAHVVECGDELQHRLQRLLRAQVGGWAVRVCICACF